MLTVLACLRRSVERMWPPRVPTRFGPGTRLRRPKNQWNQGPLATPQAEMCPRTANSGRAMAQSVCLVVSAGDRARLEAIVADRNRPQKHVARARLVLLSADRLDVAAIARRVGISRPAVWRRQRRYAEAGVDGLLRDKTRKPGKAPLGDGLVRRLVALTCAEPPGGVTHWTRRAMAEAVGVSLRSVQRVWAAHKLQPHRVRTFKRSRDPAFLAKLAAIVGLYMAPPRHAVVLSVDEKSQIQALDRTRPG